MTSMCPPSAATCMALRPFCTKWQHRWEGTVNTSLCTGDQGVKLYEGVHTQDKGTAIVVLCCTEGEHANGQGVWSSRYRWHSLHHKITHLLHFKSSGSSITSKQCCCLRVVFQVPIAWYSKFAAMVWSMTIWPLITISQENSLLTTEMEAEYFEYSICDSFHYHRDLSFRSDCRWLLLIYVFIYQSFFTIKISELTCHTMCMQLLHKWHVRSFTFPYSRPFNVICPHAL